MNIQSLRIAVESHVTLAVDVFDPPQSLAADLILLHGGGQNRHAWRATARALQRAGYRVVTYDARGHGDSDWDCACDYSMERLARDLFAVRQSLSLHGPVVGVGASMGGQTLLAAHRLAPPDLWAGIALVDVTTRVEPDGVKRIIDFMYARPDGFATLDEVAEAIAAYLPHRARSAATSSSLSKVVRRHPDGRWRWRWDPSMMARAREAARDPGQWLAYLREFEPPMIEGARRIVAPTLVVRGAQSDVVSPSAVADCVRHIPHAQVAEVGAAAHMVAGDSNAAFTHVVLDFLTGIARAADARRAPQESA